jgi:hypothetical protein
LDKIFDNPETFSREELIKRVTWYDKKFGPYIEKRGLKNVKNLFRKPTGQEVISFFLMLMLLVMAWAYNYDTESCRKTIAENPECFGVTDSVGNLLINSTEFSGGNSNIPTCKDKSFVGPLQGNETYCNNLGVSS